MGRKRLSARIRANRLNAKKSTGPKTAEGKKRSADNSFLHGLTSIKSDFASHPETDYFVKLICVGDQRSEVVLAASELSDAQFWLNSIRQYDLILQVLKSKGQMTMLPKSNILDDPVISEILDYVSTGETKSFGPLTKSDLRFQKRIINFANKQASRNKDPDRERKRLIKYEKLALRRRLAAIEKFDNIRFSASLETQ